MIDGDIALSLSGGGFRATLFHLGVLAALRQLDRLKQVKVISCVSGGSITGAHAALHWEDFNGSDEAFKTAAARLLELTQMDVRGRIVRRLPRRRQRGFERCLDQCLFSKALLSEVVKAGRPRLVLNTTDLKHGAAAAFVDHYFVPDVRKQTGPDGSPARIDVGPFTLASAVACSAGFPAFFPAREISARDFAQPRKALESGASLADGGIYDNLGIQYFLGLAVDKRPMGFIVSDAGAPFDYQAGIGGNIIQRAARIANVQMELLRAAVMDDAFDTPMQITLLSIAHEPVDEEARGCADILRGIPPPEIVRRLQLVRTDLDAFSEVESDLLIRHGFTVALKALAGTLRASPSCQEVWSVSRLEGTADSATIQAYATALGEAERRRLGLFNSRDRAFPLPWFLIFIAVAIIMAAAAMVAPFVKQTIRSPLVDRVVTGRPYRLLEVVRYVALEPGERGGGRGVKATTRLFYWLRPNRKITASDAVFSEVFTPTYERAGSVHGLGVIGARALRESEGTLPFDTRPELLFDAPRGEARLYATGIEYDFLWPGPVRSLEGISFRSDEDYWAYDNLDDYIDRLEIVVESRSNELLLSGGSDCAILFHANRSVDRFACRSGEATEAPGARALTSYGGSLVAHFGQLQPGDQAVLKYRLSWR